MKRHARIDAILTRPAVRSDLEELKRLVGLAAERSRDADQPGHVAAALDARDVALRIVGVVCSETGNSTLPREQVYRYVANVAHQELLGPQAKAEDLVLFELGVRLPAGRPPTSRPRARQTLIDEIRSRPELPDWRIEARARELEVWAPDQADDPANVRRRIRRLRSDAAN